jgi:hypothetical protein
MVEAVDAGGEGRSSCHIYKYRAVWADLGVWGRYDLALAGL